MKKQTEMLKKYIQDTKEVIKMMWHNLHGLSHNAVILYLHKAHKVRVFYGRSAYWFAKRYADKKYKQWPDGIDRLGKQQYVIPLGDDDGLIVCSRLEVKTLQKRGVVHKNRHYPKLVRKNYYETKRN